MPTTAAFRKHYAALNDRQKEAVDAIDGPVMVIAGPGTGKTKVLTVRIATILARTDTPPEAILALTFTESGATEMRARLAALIGPDAYRVVMTTFHAFCNSVILDYPESFPEFAGAASLTEPDQAALMQELIDTTPGLAMLRPVNAPDLYLKAAMSSINTLKRENVTPECVRACAHAEEDEKQALKLAELATLYAAYQSVLRARKFYDYNDMIMEVASALERDESLRLQLQERHHYFLIDEHQDTNNAQNRVIELLVSYWDRPNLFIVGDARQAIYRFQGASLENFLYFKDKYPSVKLITLEQNYRSSQLILDAAGTTLKAHAKRTNIPIRLITAPEPDMQYWMIARDIAKRLKSGTAPESIAVLARENNDLEELMPFLEREGVPSTRAAAQNAFDDRHLRQLLLILDALRQFGEPAPLYRALHVPSLHIDPLDIYQLIQNKRNPYRSPLAAPFSAWARLAMQPEAAEALETIVRESGLLAAILVRPDAPEALEKLHAFYGLLKSHIQRNRTLTLAQFAASIDFVRSRGIPLAVSTGMTAPNCVRLMTAHKSKGLEFDIVYLIDCIDGHWGARTRRELIKLPKVLFFKRTAQPEPSAADDEERNLFYVALTRARKELIIARSERDRAGTEQLPARYLADIKPSLMLHHNTQREEKLWRTARASVFAQRPHQPARHTDAAYVNALFAQQGLSVTALNNYLACPWRYFYTNLVRIPEAPVFALMYGTAVDRALQNYFDQLVAGTRGTKAELLHRFRQCLNEQPLQQRDRTTAEKRGAAALGGYYDQHHREWNKHVINQLRIPAVELNGISLNGKIDKIELLEPALGAGPVRVVDYKTGKPKSRNHIIGAVKNGDGNYFRQLVFYKLLLDRWQKGKYRMQEGVIDFVEPDERGKWHREVFAVTSAHVRELEQVIGRVADEIQGLKFWDMRCDDRECLHCALRDLME